MNTQKMLQSSVKNGLLSDKLSCDRWIFLSIFCSSERACSNGNRADRNGEDRERLRCTPSFRATMS